MSPIYAMLASTDRWFVVICTVVSFLLGAVWYHKNVFGTLYGQRMKFPKDFMDMSKETKQESMRGSLVLEIVSRFIFFLGLNQAFVLDSRSEVSDGLVFVILAWLFFVFSTQLSQIAWSRVDKKVIFLTSGKILLDMLLATLYRYMI